MYFEGKKILYDIVAFAKESVNSHVITLGPQNFPDKDKEPWLVDFFAPVNIWYLYIPPSKICSETM